MSDFIQVDQDNGDGINSTPVIINRSAIASYGRIPNVFELTNGRSIQVLDTAANISALLAPDVVTPMAPPS